MAARRRYRTSLIPKEPSPARIRTLQKLSCDADRLAGLFLAADDTEPRIFEEADRKALRVVMGLVAEAEHTFTRLRRLRLERVRWGEAMWLATYVFANLDSVDAVKRTVEYLIVGSKADRSNTLPRDVNALMADHHALYRRLARKGGDDNERAKCLIDLLQLELIWFGKMW